MKSADTILQYLKKTYQPEAIIVYGSFADQSAGEASDFDALVIAGREKVHDGSVVDGTTLDVFIYPPETFDDPFDPEEFLPIADGTIALDRNGTAERAQKSVIGYIRSVPEKTGEEVREEVAWCEKMLDRAARNDAEGCFRLHYLLTESLEIYCDIKKMFYYGPKKALRAMAQDDPDSFSLYARALKEADRDATAAWTERLKRLAD